MASKVSRINTICLSDIALLDAEIDRILASEPRESDARSRTMSDLLATAA